MTSIEFKNSTFVDSDFDDSDVEMEPISPLFQGEITLLHNGG